MFKSLRATVSLPRILRCALGALAISPLATGAASAQSTTATISGIVVNQRQVVIAGATVTAVNEATRLTRNATCSDEGYFTITLLPPGNYTLTFEREGFAQARISNVILNVDDRRTLQIELKIGAITEVVTIDGASLINESPAVGTVIDRQFVGNLPLNGRSLQLLILLTPGVVPTVSNETEPGEFSVNGQRSNANYFIVDGVSANIGVNIRELGFSEQLGGAVPGLSALGTTSSLVSIDALEEFKILTSTYSAELGRQPGGQVQLVTRSGTNDFHGTVFEYLRNEVFDANDWFANSAGLKRAPLRQNLFGGTFSGPVILPNFGEEGSRWYYGKNRTYFFFSYEGLRLRLPKTDNLLVPSLRLRQNAAPGWQPLLNALPRPTGPELTNSAGVPTGAAPFVAGYSSPKRTDATSIRLDHTFSKKVTMFGRYNEAPSEDGSRSGSFIFAGRAETRTLTLGSTSLFSPSVNNEFKFNYSSNRGRNFRSMDDFGGAVPVDPSLFVSEYNGSGPKFGEVFFDLVFNINAPTMIGGLGDLSDSYQRQINVIDNVSYVNGAHQFKFGFDYRRLASTYGPQAYLAQVFPDTEASILNGRASVFIAAAQGVRPRFDNYSLYAQDQWKLTPRLTVDLGLRWELNPAPHDADGKRPALVALKSVSDLSNASLAPPDAPVYKTFYTAFAPRVGVAYQLNQALGRETVLRSGFGVYYDLGSGQALNPFSRFPFTASTFLSDVPFPLSPSQAQPPNFPSLTLPTTFGLFGTDPNLKLPYTLHWNVSVGQSLGKSQTLTLSYVAAAARRLLGTLRLNQPVGNPRRRPNPNFSQILYTTNGPTSDYNSLQAQFQRRLSRGLQSLVSYTWSHAIDEVSSEVNSLGFERGNASFDIRHNFSTALTYDIPGLSANPGLKLLLRNWSVDSTVYVQSGQPLDLIAGSFNREDGTFFTLRPDIVLGQPFWIKDPAVPGGQRLNRAAFLAPPVGPGGPMRQGTLGRNVVVEPGKYQLNLAVRREFKFFENVSLQFRAEAFNLFNHPLFGSYSRSIVSPTFGVPTTILSMSSFGGLNALYQMGGPRSMQFTARVSF